MSLFVDPQGGPRLRVVGSLVRVLASREQTGGAYEIFELDGAEGHGPPPHRHPWSESYLVMDGEADVLIEGALQRARRGDFVHVPANAKHTYRIATSQARFLVIASPEGATRYFEDVDDETDLTVIAEVSRKHGVK